MDTPALGLRNRLKLRQLSLVVALHEEGSLHKAARKLGMTQPAATRLLGELEDSLRARLFERSHTGMAATDMGALLVRHAALILAGVDQVQADVAAMASGTSGQLNIGQFSSAPPSLLARAIVHIKRLTPQLQVRVIEGPQELLIHALRDGELHLAIGRAPAQAFASYLNFEVLLQERFSVVCGVQSRHRPLREALGIGQLIDAPWILPLPSTPLRASLDLQFWAQCGRTPTDVIEYSSAHTGIALLRESDYVALLPSHVAAEYALRKAVRVLLREVPDLLGPIGVMTRQSEALPSHGSRLMDALRACARA